jgi:hypothetical protein
VKTIAELFRDWYLRQTAHVHGARRDGPGRDWRLILPTISYFPSRAVT